MAKRDYYEVLGVQKNATPEEIKKSFRNRARSLHPDNKESGDEAAFKELAEAYEVLSDDQRRAAYDRYGHEGVKGSTRGFDNMDFSSFAGFGIDDFIDFFFGGGAGMRGGRRGGPEQGSHLKYDLQIEFLDAVFGCETKVNVKRLEECTGCNGSGAAPGSTPVKCVTCAGMGQVQQVMNSWFGQTMRVIECPACQGHGQKIDKPCRDCKGEGLVRKQREFQLKVPRGIEPNSRLRLTSAGDKGRRGGPYGDLFVIIHIKEHKTFIRDGETIHVKQPIGFSLAALGGEIMVPTVDGSKLLHVPSGCQSGTVLVMKDLGVPRFNHPTRRGDQVVHLIVETPSKLSG
ncbi:MAG TPA: molecular chaperone DnaJ, partial [Chroococcales cyanobacterium]